MKNKNKILALDIHDKRLWIIMSLILLFFINFAVNGWVELKAQCLDDLTYWTLYNNKKAIDFVFNTEAGKLRIVYNIIILFVYKFVGNNVGYFDTIILIFNYFVCLVVYFIGKKISSNDIVGFLVAIGYLVSRYAYYQISQVFGIMEGTAVILSIIMVYCLYEHINDLSNKNNRYYYFACFAYLLICYVHERYILLFILIIITSLFKGTIKNVNLKNLFIPVIIFLFVMISRILIIGDMSIEGTGGTSIFDTLNIIQILIFICAHILYLFGINIGGPYLSGINIIFMNKFILFIVILSDICIISLICLFGKCCIKNKEKRLNYLKSASLFIFAIGIFIASSSVTIRLELRWVYVSFTCMLLLMTYMIKIINENKTLFKYNKTYIGNLLIIIYITLLIPCELYHRYYYKNLYYWKTQEQYNSLYDVTQKIYNDEIFSRKIIVVNDSFDNMTNEDAERFFGQFRSYSSQTIQLDFTNNLSKINLDDIKSNPIIIGQSSISGLYMDLTNTVTNSIKLQIENPTANNEQTMPNELESVQKVSGAFEDGWLGKTSEFNIHTKKEGKISLTAYYPFDDFNDKSVIFYVNDTPQKYNFTSNQFIVELEAPKNQIVNLKIVSDFDFQADPPDQRRLSFILSDIIGK